MPGQWQGSTRRGRLPPDWPAIRTRILNRDSRQCTWMTNDNRCTAPATDVDHIIPGDDHSDLNLRSLCGAHHRYKSGHEGGSAAKTVRMKPRNRPPERHPGLA